LQFSSMVDDHDDGSLIADGGISSCSSVSTVASPTSSNIHCSQHRHVLTHDRHMLTPTNSGISSSSSVATVSSPTSSDTHCSRHCRHCHVPKHNQHMLTPADTDSGISSSSSVATVASLTSSETHRHVLTHDQHVLTRADSGISSSSSVATVASPTSSETHCRSFDVDRHRHRLTHDRHMLTPAADDDDVTSHHQQHQHSSSSAGLFYCLFCTQIDMEDMSHICCYCHIINVLVFSLIVLFFSHPRSECWPHHGRTFSIYLCSLSF